ncbi:MAG: hypothetical protein FJ137_09045 [Deltaproteobacteria bacterium]|nr:hypothetical protein [Deltaproteobacteria bacterium]
MTKNTINRPGLSPTTVPRSPSSGRPSTSDKLKDKKQAQAADRRPPVQRPQRAQRPQGVAGPHGAAGAHAAADDHGDDGAAGAGASNAVGGAESSEDLHRRRHGDSEVLWEMLHDERVERVEEPHETAASGADAVKRSKGGEQQGGSDGFEQGQQQREAYERLLKGNVKSDQERYAELRKKGHKDDFRPERPPPDVEKLGLNRVVAHVVRLYDAWTLEGVKREAAVPQMAAWMAQLSSPQVIKKVLQELESKPIRDVYPLEIVMHMLEHRADLVPGLRKGAVIANSDELASGRKCFAGHAVQVQVPPDTRLKSFALLGGARPGYEFFPTPGDDHKYTLLIDTPGRWTFALLAAPLVSLGRIQKEGNDLILELLQVTVSAMGKKGEPISPEDWWAQQQAEAEAAASLDAEGDDGGDGGDGGDGAALGAPSRGSGGTTKASAPAVPPAPLLILQIRTALDAIARDEVTGPAAATYSWDLRLYRPGLPAEGDGVLHLVVERAGPFDPVWAKAREAINQKQRLFEPGRALLTQEDLAAALRRARVR